ncbi:MAG TPA: M23 family metallopeptidase [Gemmatimonadaceae bacterium]|nr:M23 family metallopeptidase [Gemmatimonadaceae bacterium]
MRSSLVLLAALLVACDTISRDATLKDSGQTIADTAAGTVALDTGAAHYGAVGDTTKGVLTDTGAVTLHPASPRRGGVLVALLPGDSVSSARCTWKGAMTPCHNTASGVRAFVPISADDTAGTFTLTIETPNARVSRQIVVADHDYGRELILLSDTLFALIKRRAEISRDARAVRQVLSTMSPEQRWQGRWREATRSGEKTSPYGIERFYAHASDSTRSIQLGAALKSPGGFGTDTLRSNVDLPGWRHTGVDIARFKGSVVTAPAAGLVADVGQYTLMGKTVILDHGLGVFTAYFHLDTALVRRGDVVTAGKQLGRVGSTGLATGPHIHYGVYVNGRDVEPALWHAAVEWMEGAGRTVARGRDTATATKGKAR